MYLRASERFAGTSFGEIMARLDPMQTIASGWPVTTLSKYGIVIALLALTLACPCVAPAANPANGQGEAIRNFVETYSSQRDQYRLDLSVRDQQNLGAGKTLIKVLKAPREAQAEHGDSFGVLAMKIVEAPRLLVWLAMIADSNELDGRFTRAVLSDVPGGSKVRYQHLNLPWPFSDRHWVIQVENYVDIAKASEGRIWERRWQLHARGRELIDAAYADGDIVGLTPQVLDHSIYLPTNRGSWTVLDLAQNRTLVAAFVDMRLGGLIPDGLVRGYIKRELRDGFTLLDKVIERAHTNADGPRRYYDGWGHPISSQDAIVARLNWKGEADPGDSRE